MLNIQYLGLTQLIIDFSNFCTKMCSGLDVNKNANSRINLIFVGAFHSKNLSEFASVDLQIVQAIVLKMKSFVW